jgi:mannose-6-phosphate isomerase-like protein (cupin superfamily)
LTRHCLSPIRPGDASAGWCRRDGRRECCVRGMPRPRPRTASIGLSRCLVMNLYFPEPANVPDVRRWIPTRAFRKHRAASGSVCNQSSTVSRSHGRISYLSFFHQPLRTRSRSFCSDCPRQTPLRRRLSVGVHYGRRMDGFAIDRSDGRQDGEDWTENYEELPGGANISIIPESTTKAGVGPRLHKHPYAETFIIRRGWATFTVGSEEFRGRAGQVLIVPADPPHKFSTGPDGYEGVHIHAGVRFVTEWLE